MLRFSTSTPRKLVSFLANKDSLACATCFYYKAMKKSALANVDWTLWPCLFIGFALAAGLRLFVLTQPLWLDELHTAWVVDTSLDQVSTRAAAGNQAPLYFWLTWLITQAAGISPISLRLSSFTSNLLLIALAARFVFKWTNSMAAILCVVLLMALDPLMVFYATEARPYGLLQLAGFIQIVIFWDFWREVTQGGTNPRAWVRVMLLAACSAALFYLHYTSALLLAAEAAFVLTGLCLSWHRNRPLWGTLSKCLASFVLTVLFCALSAGPLRLVFARRDQWFEISSAAGLLHEIWPSLVFAVGMPSAIGGLVWLSGRCVGQVKESFQIELLSLFATCALVPIAIVCVADRIGLLPLAHSRYVVISFVAMFVFAAVSIGNLKSGSARWTLAAIVLVSIVVTNPLVRSLVKTGELTAFRREHWESPIQQINALETEATSPVFLLANLFEDRDAARNHQTEFQDYLKFPVNGIYKINNVKRVIPLNSAAENPFSESQVELIAGQGSAWILFRATPQHVQQVLSSLQNKLDGSLDLEYFASPDSDVILVRVRRALRAKR